MCRKKIPLISFVVLGLLSIGFFLLGNPAQIIQSAPSDVNIYTDTLSAGWEDWSWGTTRSLANPSPVYAGSASIAVTYSAAWGGFYLHDAGISTSGITALRFWVHGGSSDQSKLAISAAQCAVDGALSCF